MAAKKRSTGTRKGATKKSATKKSATKKSAAKKSATKKSAGSKKASKKKSGKKGYSEGASRKVGETMHEMKRGKLRSGRSKKKVTSRKQAIAIGLSQARKRGAKVPRKKG
jgi:hypothetical protein